MGEIERMNLCERDGEIRQIRGLLAESREGHGRVALISAAAGSGKTALLRELDAELSDDVISLGASCVPPDRDVPYGMLTELLESPALGAEDARRARKLLENRTVLAGSGFSRLIRDMAEQKPVVITVDGIHDADPESVVHLVRVVRRVPSDRVLVVLTERPQPAEAYSALHSELLGRPHVSFIRLRPLSPRGVREMVEADTGARAADPPAADLHALTGGSPLLVQALLQDLRASGQTAVADVPPGGPAFGHALLGCLHSAGPTTLAVARGIALLDGAATHALLRRLLDLPLEAVARAVAELDAVGLVHGCRLRHPAAVRVILGEMAQEDRTAWHRRAARLLLDSGAAAAGVARQLLHVERVAETWMAQALVDGAGELLDEDDGEQARACALLALRAGIGDLRLQAEAVAALARAELLLCPAAAPRLYPYLSAAIRHGHLSPRLALELPGILWWHGRAGQNQRLYGHLARLVDGANPGPAMELRACGTMLTTVFPQLAERIPDLRDQSSDLELASAAFTTATRMKVSMHLRTVQTQGPRADAVRSAEHVLGATRLTHRTVEPLAMAVATLLGCDRPRSARKWADRLLTDATDRGAAHWEGLMAALRSQAALYEGDLVGVEHYARRALRRMPPQAWGVGLGTVYALLLRAFTETRRHGEAAELLSRPVPEMLFESTPGLLYLHAKGCHHLATHQYEAALADFHACGELMAKWGMSRSTIGPWRCGAAQALLELGEPDAAGRLAEEQLSALASGGHSRVRGMALRVLAATRAPEQRSELLVQAVNQLRYSGDRVELAKALTDLEDTQRLLGESGPAGRAVRPSLHAVIGGRAALPVQLTAVSAPDAPSAHPEPAEDTSADLLKHLTDAERRVCDLAARGRSNREIAGELFITVSTVEQHLTRIYRKLNVKGRQDLPVEQVEAHPDTLHATPPTRLRKV
ncbi:AAA family ATPase [Streptomyces sp. NBC_01530]|uniref:helix-turn-helix transcriptional regulator n=2 Tax=unclassified Streptomyces TaxID=2593676 RepID=UPI0038632383